MLNFIFMVTLMVAVVLLSIGIVKNQSIFILFAGIAFIFAGVMLWNGLEYVEFVTYTAVDNSTATYTDNYNYRRDNYSTGLGIFLSLLGLFIFLVSVISVIGQKKNNWFD